MAGARAVSGGAAGSTVGEGIAAGEADVAVEAGGGAGSEQPRKASGRSKARFVDRIVGKVAYLSHPGRLVREPCTRLLNMRQA